MLSFLSWFHIGVVIGGGIYEGALLIFSVQKKKKVEERSGNWSIMVCILK